MAIFRGHSGAVLSVAVATDVGIDHGELIVSGGDYKTVKVWSTASNDCTAVLEAHEESVSSVAVPQDGSCIVFSSYDRAVLVWRRQGDMWLTSQVLSCHADDVNCVALSGDCCYKRRVSTYNYFCSSFAAIARCHLGTHTRTPGLLLTPLDTLPQICDVCCTVTGASFCDGLQYFANF